MLRKLFGMAAVLCLITLPTQAADEKGDKDKLEGAMENVSMSFMGMTLETPKDKQAVLTFKGDKVTIFDPMKKKEEDGTYKVDDKKKPKEIDLTGPKDDNPKELETI